MFLVPLLNIFTLLSKYTFEQYFLAFGLTLIAGLSTGIGSIMVMASKRTNTKFLSLSLGFSAGVMIYVSFVDMFDLAKTTIIGDLGEKTGMWITVISFFGGMALITLIDKLIPKKSNPHEIASNEDINEISGNHTDKFKIKKQSLLRTGLLTAIALTIHNFPEGIATFFSALSEPTLAVGITIAIALHNIPEGISIFVPIYYATGSKKKAFTYSFLSGLSEPIGALIGFLILTPFLSNVLFGIIFAGVAGIMVFISLDELLPAAREYGNAHLSMYGFVSGMVVMALSLLLLA